MLDALDALKGQRVNIPGHFGEPVTIDGIRKIGDSYECRVKLPDGSLDETVLTEMEMSSLCADRAAPVTSTAPADAESVRLLVESARIRLAYAHDPQFAVSLSGIRTLPHQVEAVYMKMLPQPRLRFLLADDPGAGKTIMAGLLLKELKLRNAIERILILCPAPLTIQWQDELQRWFGESFDIIFSAVDQMQLVNPWRRSNQIIASLDYAKQDSVRERVWEQQWDMVIIDEAHKCSAYTKHSTTRGDEAEKTRRYQLAEKLADRCDHLLLLTATPHHGDDDRFAHFVRLIDPDLFPEPHRLADKAGEIRRDILRLGPDCPWSLRRLKEDLRDLDGRPLFPKRHADTVAFKLNAEEFDLYKAVTAYINQFLPQATGRKKRPVALARTVLQRRLASSTQAIHESIRRRLEKQQNRLEELAQLSEAERARSVARSQVPFDDVERDEDDLDEAERDRLVDEVSESIETDRLQAEISALNDLLAQARRVRDHAADSKLAALRECLAKAEFGELKDGRGKLIVFTEHRDTLNHIKKHLEQWGYSTCEIHGGMNPHERRRAQEQFRTTSQVCVATEAAGEGINLQFCRLLVNYDIPWNPTRLEQRLGRIHRIGQEREVYAYNFVAAESEQGQPVIEGRILECLLTKLARMREVLKDRVFDVIGEVLVLNDVNLPEMLREAAHNPRRLDEYLDQIENVDPAKFVQYEKATGIALARGHVDFSAFEHTNTEAEERRLMPRYVEQQFVAASRMVGLKLDRRADGLWRAEHVPADLRSERLSAIGRVGKPEPVYRKMTFLKENLEQDQHLDAVLIGPGHALYAAVDERLNEMLTEVAGSTGVFVDAVCERPYRLHFFEMSIRGQSSAGAVVPLYGELVAVREELGDTAGSEGRFTVVPADCLIDLPNHPSPPAEVGKVDVNPATDFLKSTYQTERRTRCQEERKRYVEVCRDYLDKSFKARIRAAQDRAMELRQRELVASEVALARQRADADLEDLQRSQRERMQGLERLAVAKHGPIRHIASALVLPPGTDVPSQFAALLEDIDPEIRRKSEKAAEDIVEAYETGRGWEVLRVGHQKIGFDIRSQAPPDPQTGYRDPAKGIRRIEVKGRRRGQPIRLTTNEWYKGAQLGDSYWLYVVWDPLGKPDPVPMMIQNPVKHLDHAKREVVAARYYDIPADAIEAVARKEEAKP